MPSVFTAKAEAAAKSGYELFCFGDEVMTNEEKLTKLHISFLSWKIAYKNLLLKWCLFEIWLALYLFIIYSWQEGDPGGQHSLFFFCYLRLSFIDDLIACQVKTPSWNALVIRKCKKLTLIKCLALLRSPRVVWRELSAPTGTKSFRFSRQLLRWALRFFSSSLWVDLYRKLMMRKIFIWYHQKNIRLEVYVAFKWRRTRKRNVAAHVTPL